MSLVNQLIAAIFAVLIGLVSGTIYIMSDSAEDMLLNQLESHGQDTATHLGLYMSEFMADKDTASIETTVNAIFDSGFYQRIDVVDNEGQTLFSKNIPARAGVNVPDWFVSLVEFSPPEMTREVTHQWQKVGTVFVQSRAGYAYQQLWLGVQDTLIWFVMLSLGCVVAISILMRHLLSPLKGVEEQALALSQKKYVEQDEIPTTRELGSVVQAMNLMVRQVQRMFNSQSVNIEELQRSAYQDNLTGLANQRALLSQLSEQLDHRKSFGPCTLLYVRIRNLAKLNQELGLEKASGLIKQVASMLEKMSRKSEQSILGRMTGAEFMLLIDRTDTDKLRRELDDLVEETRQIYQQISQSEDERGPICIGVAQGSDLSSSSQLISRAQLALQEAERNGEVYSKLKLSEEHTRTSENWHQRIADAISDEEILLQYQLLVSEEGTLELQREILARILDKSGVPCAAGEFIGIVKELGLIIDLDRAVINQTLSYLQQTPNCQPLTVNLSAASVRNKEFRSWLLDVVSPVKNLNLELNEASVLNNLDIVTEFREHLKNTGVGFGVDNFGIHPRGFSYLYNLQPDYVKIDGSLIQEVDTNPEDRFFVSSLITVAHSLEIKAYAERVEREPQLKRLRALKIDGVQGYLQGKPQRLR
ncbi:EAL domain-containing protein [Motiliproteus sp. MSK22-1]|uniref:bifunctional diguanylate cyclase/phosphodiesterase n=1 Tax=Motiliproteus sp. MSK22-1 TaxID=1897630 RepID=UPI0009761AA5|nr:EAL domain-containing protein [Motiliproteus sp. MSK22-1]OMH25564.1 hypothetical protein BGP75_23690 [Motiliproteus sp. MSK22-1]